MSDLGISLEQAPAQVPNAATQPAAQASAQGGGSGPWASQLAQFDESVRSSVDTFLRTNVQPYLTRLEQSNAELKDQAGLYTRLNESPAETYLQITSELFGDEAVDAVINLLTNSEDEDEETPVTPPAGEVQRDPEMEAFRQQYQADQRRTAYDKEMTRITEAAVAAGDIPVVDKLMHTFVHMTNGDFDAAYEGYKQFYGDVRTAAGVAPGPGQEQTVVPPATLGNQTTVPPIEEHYDTLDDAIDSLFADTRASAPPTVGAM